MANIELSIEIITLFLSGLFIIVAVMAYRIKNLELEVIHLRQLHSIDNKTLEVVCRMMQENTLRK